MWLFEGSFTEGVRFELSLEEDAWLSSIANYSKLGCSVLEGMEIPVYGDNEVMG